MSKEYAEVELSFLEEILVNEFKLKDRIAKLEKQSYNKGEIIF
jgi:hypothetical protein